MISSAGEYGLLLVFGEHVDNHGGASGRPDSKKVGVYSHGERRRV